MFYDDYETADLWGKDLYAHLSEVYRNKSRYCLILISRSYSAKQWCNHERMAAQARAFQENAEYVLPLRLDDTELPGVLPTVGYVDWRKLSATQVVALLKAKLAVNDDDRSCASEPRSETSPAVSSEKQWMDPKVRRQFRRFEAGCCLVNFLLGWFLGARPEWLSLVTFHGISPTFDLIHALPWATQGGLVGSITWGVSGALAMWIVLRLLYLWLRFQ